MEQRGAALHKIRQAQQQCIGCVQPRSFFEQPAFLRSLTIPISLVPIRLGCERHCIFPARDGRSSALLSTQSTQVQSALFKISVAQRIADSIEPNALGQRGHDLIGRQSAVRKFGSHDSHKLDAVAVDAASLPSASQGSQSSVSARELLSGVSSPLYAISGARLIGQVAIRLHQSVRSAQIMRACNHCWSNSIARAATASNS
jgi:hypothetical protein